MYMLALIQDKYCHPRYLNKQGKAKKQLGCLINLAVQASDVITNFLASQLLRKFTIVAIGLETATWLSSILFRRVGTKLLHGVIREY